MQNTEICYDISIYGYIYTVEADNENEAISIACDLFYEETGLPAYADDDAVCWKIRGVYPYEWN